jgi:hypothetical protein
MLHMLHFSRIKTVCLISLFLGDLHISKQLKVKGLLKLYVT